MTSAVAPRQDDVPPWSRPAPEEAADPVMDLSTSVRGVGGVRPRQTLTVDTASVTAGRVAKSVFSIRSLVGADRADRADALGPASPPRPEPGSPTSPSGQPPGLADADLDVDRAAAPAEGESASQSAERRTVVGYATRRAAAHRSADVAYVAPAGPPARRLPLPAARAKGK